jgi:hypothetical protein
MRYSTKAIVVSLATTVVAFGAVFLAQPAEATDTGCYTASCSSTTAP